MPRKTGTYDRTSTGGEEVAAFVPFALPPRAPLLTLGNDLEASLPEPNRL